MRTWRAQPVLVRDAVLAALILVGLVAAAVAGDRTDVHLAVAGLVVLGTLSVAWRRRAPVVTVVASSLALVVGAYLVGPGSGALSAAIIGVYSAIAWGHRLLGTLAAVVQVAGVALAVTLQGGSWQQDDVGLTGFVLAATVATGFAVGSRRAAVAVERERAEHAEQTREVEAARRVAEERLRIARELHDVLGHHVAVIGVQSAVAEAVLTRDPEAAQVALDHVQDASRTALAELSALVHVLRESDDDAPAGPVPGLAQLEDLLAEVEATGLTVVASVTGPVRDLAPVVDLAAYRVVQESLTNAHKHGVGPATVARVYGDGTLTLEVTNAIPDRTATPGTGYGLRGMRERVEAVGGTVVAGPRGRDFHVHAVLPTLAVVPPDPEAGP